jgi:hypothetical protein
MRDIAVSSSGMSLMMVMTFVVCVSHMPCILCWATLLVISCPVHLIRRGHCTCCIFYHSISLSSITAMKTSVYISYIKELYKEISHL